MFGILKKHFLEIYKHYSKGASIDAAMQKTSRSRSPKAEYYLRPGAEPIHDGETIAYHAIDIIRRWEIKQKGILILKNNSEVFAYNVELLNADAIFFQIEKLEKLTSIGPNEKIELNFTFVQHHFANSGLDADKVPDIPADKENKYLEIQYKNQSGTKFLTRFVISFSQARNEYWFK